MSYNLKDAFDKLNEMWDEKKEALGDSEICPKCGKVKLANDPKFCKDGECKNCVPMKEAIDNGFVIKVKDIGGYWGKEFYFSELGYVDILKRRSEVEDEFDYWAEDIRIAHVFNSYEEAANMIREHLADLFGYEEEDGELIGKLADGALFEIYDLGENKLNEAKDEEEDEEADEEVKEEDAEEVVALFEQVKEALDALIPEDKEDFDIKELIDAVLDYFDDEEAREYICSVVCPEAEEEAE